MATTAAHGVQDLRECPKMPLMQAQVDEIHTIKANLIIVVQGQRCMEERLLLVEQGPG